MTIKQSRKDLAAARRRLEAAPDDRDAWIAKARAHMALGEAPGAVEAWARVAALAPLAGWTTEAALAAYANGDEPGAAALLTGHRAALLAATSSDPSGRALAALLARDDARPLDARGAFHRWVGDALLGHFSARAWDAYDRAVALDPADAWGWFRRWHSGRLPRDDGDLRRAIDLAADVELIAHLAYWAEHRLDREEARRACRKGPSCPAPDVWGAESALRVAAWLLADNLTDDALAVYRLARVGQPGCPIHWFATNAGASPEAIAALDARVKSGAPMDARSIFWEIHAGLPRQAPGSDATTRRLLSLCGPLPPAPAVLDVGCGPGRATRVLADALPDATLTAVDLHQPFLDELGAAAVAAGIDHRVARVRASMTEMPFEDGRFDLIWSEGAVYVMGVAEALRAWRRMLRPGGRLVFTEATWFTDAPSPAAAAFWAAYAGMASEAANRARAEAAGYAVVDTHRLPASDWVEYYDPIAARLDAYDTTDPEVAAAVAAERAELDLYRDHGDEYGYTGYVLRRVE